MHLCLPVECSTSGLQSLWHCPSVFQTFQSNFLIWFSPPPPPTPKKCLSTCMGLQVRALLTTFILFLRKVFLMWVSGVWVGMLGFARTPTTSPPSFAPQATARSDDHPFDTPDERAVPAPPAIHLQQRIAHSVVACNMTATARYRDGASLCT